MDCAYRWLRYNWLSLRRHVDIEYVNDAVHRVAVRKVLVQEWSEGVARVLKETKKQNTRSATPLKARNTTPPVTVVGIYSSKPIHTPTPLISMLGLVWARLGFFFDMRVLLLKI